jgi:hypothetical protein
MRIVVSDSSCLIDLRKVSLLDALLKLPCEFLIPDTLFEDELLKFTTAQKKALVRGGLKVIDLPGERVLRAQAIIRQSPRLSVNDGFAFALARDIGLVSKRGFDQKNATFSSYFGNTADCGYVTVFTAPLSDVKVTDSKSTRNVIGFPAESLIVYVVYPLPL